MSVVEEDQEVKESIEAQVASFLSGQYGAVDEDSDDEETPKQCEQHEETHAWHEEACDIVQHREVQHREVSVRPEEKAVDNPWSNWIGTSRVRLSKPMDNLWDRGAGWKSHDSAPESHFHSSGGKYETNAGAKTDDSAHTWKNQKWWYSGHGHAGAKTVDSTYASRDWTCPSSTSKAVAPAHEQKKDGSLTEEVLAEVLKWNGGSLLAAKVPKQIKEWEKDSAKFQQHKSAIDSAGGVKSFVAWYPGLFECVLAAGPGTETLYLKSTKGISVRY